MKLQLVATLFLASCGIAISQVPEGESSSIHRDSVPSASHAPQEGESVTQGKVLFSQGDAQARQAKGKIPLANADVDISDGERDAITFTSYMLDVHFAPERRQMTVRVQMSIRNDGGVPLKRLAVEVSSSLQWESLREVTDSGDLAAAVVQHRIDTDADHTGAATEAVVLLKQPLQPKASVTLTGIYSGSIEASSGRLSRIGAPAEEASSADWDEASEEQIALRGYGDVLWYPVAGAPAFLGDGAKLFQAVGRAKLRQAVAKVRLRIEMEYVGEAPISAYFCGRRQVFDSVRDDENVPVAESRGVATASWSEEALGFRVPSLFVTELRATSAGGGLIDAISEREDAVAQYGQAAKLAAPLLREWLGAVPIRPLTIFDHHGQPFEDGALLVTPMHTTDAELLAPILVHTLSHAWFRSSEVWLDEGVAQFMSLLWIEQAQGRDAVLSRLQEDATALALIEPTSGTEGGESLLLARDEVYYRTKAAAVLWMLRAIVGDDALKEALADYRKSGDGERDFQRVLEARSHQSLSWFFDDWVYRDRGLPDLSIVSVNPREMPAVGGKEAGWLVAVEVRNEGQAVADVAVTVRSGALHGELTKTERLRIPGGATASTRVVFEGTPEEVVVNDGTVPEVGGGRHVREIVSPR